MYTARFSEHVSTAGHSKLNIWWHLVIILERWRRYSLRGFHSCSVHASKENPSLNSSSHLRCMLEARPGLVPGILVRLIWCMALLLLVEYVNWIMVLWCLWKWLICDQNHSVQQASCTSWYISNLTCSLIHFTRNAFKQTFLADLVNSPSK